MPEDEIVEGYSGYSSRWFVTDQAWPSDWWWKVLFLRLATPERPYFIGFFPMENQRWLLSYIGVNKSYPPRDESDFTSGAGASRDPGRAPDGTAHGIDLAGLFQSCDAEPMAAL